MPNLQMRKLRLREANDLLKDTQLQVGKLRFHAITICGDFQAPPNKVSHCFPICMPIKILE